MRIPNIDPNALLINIVLLIFFSLPVQAQSPTDVNSAAQQLQRIQQEQQIRQQQQFEEDLKSSKPPVIFDVLVDEPAPAEPGGPCLEINTIQLLAVTQLKLEVFQPVLDKYLGRCLNVGEIERLMSEVTAIYILKGYISTRVYLVEQDLKGGVLILQVVEGELEKVDINDPDSISLFNVYPGKIGKPLNLRDIEQAVDQINRLQSNNVTTSILPGSTAGGSILTLENTTTKPWKVNVSYDNYGAESTGVQQGGINLGFDNLFGLNDFVSVTHTQTAQYYQGSQGSQSTSLTYVVPFGYSKLFLNGSRSEYFSPLNLPSGATLISSGNTDTLSLGVDRTVFRNRDSKLNLAALVTSKDTENYLEGALLSVNSRKLSVVDLESTYSLRFLGGAMTLSLGFSRGVDWFGALDDLTDLPSFAPRAQFDKWKYGLSYFRQFQLNEQLFSFSSQLKGQYASDVLYGSEMLSIGGIYTVRGFSQNGLSGERGFYWRNDLSIPISGPPIHGYASSLRPYIGFDYGKVVNNSVNVPDGELAGVALGVSLSVANLIMDLYSSKALDKPANMSDEGNLSYFRVSMSF